MHLCTHSAHLTFFYFCSAKVKSRGPHFLQFHVIVLGPSTSSDLWPIFFQRVLQKAMAPKRPIPRSRSLAQVLGSSFWEVLGVGNYPFWGCLKGNRLGVAIFIDDDQGPRPRWWKLARVPFRTFATRISSLLLDQVLRCFVFVLVLFMSRGLQDTITV